MEKSDLKDGMFLLLRNGKKRAYFSSRIYTISANDGILCAASNLEYYNEELNHISNKDFDVMKVLYDDEIIWERTDWREIPVGAPVLVRDMEEEEWKKAKFITYYDNKHTSYPYRALVSFGNDNCFRFCKLDPIEPIYDEIKAE